MAPFNIPDKCLSTKGENTDTRESSIYCFSLARNSFSMNSWILMLARREGPGILSFWGPWTFSEVMVLVTENCYEG